MKKKGTPFFVHKNSKKCQQGFLIKSKFLVYKETKLSLTLPVAG